MTSELNVPLVQSMDDVALVSGLSVADKHFDIVNSSINRNKHTQGNIQNATKNLLEQESGKPRPIPTTTKSQSSKITFNLDDSKDESISENEKRTETPDSDIIVLDNRDDNESTKFGICFDTELSDSETAAVEEPFIEREYDPSIDDRLPDTVTLLTTPDGGKLYLIGTAHFSAESQEDVSTIIQAVQPNVVMIELCKARIHLLQLDEKTILEEAANISFQTVRTMIQQNGPYKGLLHILLLNMSAHLTRELGMAPGGEFRRAFMEAQKIKNCLIYLGDRSIDITLQRALSALSWWQALKFGWHLLTGKEPISKEEIERCKRRDMLEEMLAEIAGEFPALGQVLVQERDIFLTYALQYACLPQRTETGLKPSRVVGVVGIGHMNGIIEHWGTVQPSEILPIIRIPPPALSTTVIRITIKASLAAAVLYIGYKVIPLPCGLILQSFKSMAEGAMKCLLAIISDISL